MVPGLPETITRVLPHQSTTVVDHPYHDQVETPPHQAAATVIVTAVRKVTVVLQRTVTDSHDHLTATAAQLTPLPAAVTVDRPNVTPHQLELLKLTLGQIRSLVHRRMSTAIHHPYNSLGHPCNHHPGHHRNRGAPVALRPHTEVDLPTPAPLRRQVDHQTQGATPRTTAAAAAAAARREQTIPPEIHPKYQTILLLGEVAIKQRIAHQRPWRPCPSRLRHQGGHLPAGLKKTLRALPSLLLGSAGPIRSRRARRHQSDPVNPLGAAVPNESAV